MAGGPRWRTAGACAEANIAGVVTTKASWDVRAFATKDPQFPGWPVKVQLRDAITEQPVSTYDFATSLRVALREYAPDVVLLPGPGASIGAACARELAAPGRTVLVIEAGGDTGQAWRAAAGMLAPQIEADGGDPDPLSNAGSRRSTCSATSPTTQPST